MTAWRRSVSINASNTSTRRKMMNPMGDSDPEALATEKEEYELVLSFYPPSVLD